MDAVLLNYGKFKNWLDDRNTSAAQAGEKPEVSIEALVGAFVLQRKLPANQTDLILGNWKKDLPPGTEKYQLGRAKNV